MIRRRARDLPLFWKLLVPFLVLLITLGSAGTFVLVRSLSSRAKQTLDADLTQRSVAVRSFVHDQEIYVQESANFTANLQGMASAVKARDKGSAAVLLRSVLALKADLTLVAITDQTGAGLVQFSRSGAGTTPTEDPAVSWAQEPIVAPVLAGTTETTHGGFIGYGDHPTVALATTICAGTGACVPVGTAIVAVDAARLAVDAQSTSARNTAGVALYDAAGRQVGASGKVPRTPPPRLGQRDFLRQNTHVDRVTIATLYAPLSLHGDRAGTLAVSIPTAPVFSSVRGAAGRLGLGVLAAMIGVVAIGAILSRFILAQVRPLVATNRALADGDLSARAPVFGHDELGELAEGVNQMAATLEETYATLEARVQDRTAAVERLLQERTDFFTAVSHEFRTPLAVILGQAKMLGDGNFAKKAAWHSQAASVLTDAGNQLLAFVNDILDIAKVESGRAHLDLVQVRADAVVQNLEATIEVLTARSGLSLAIQVASELPPVWADAAGLRQVVLNLVDNAVKYTPVGGKVSISVERVGDTIAISISDTGVGIPPEASERLFEPFYRVKGTETQSGQPSSGLGLALVKGLTEAMGGDVSFESEVGKGSTFVLSFPVSIPTADANQEGDTPREVAR